MDDDDLTSDEINELSDAMGGDEGAGDVADSLGDDLGGGSEEAADEGGEDHSISHAQFMQLEENDSAEELPPKPIERMYDVKVKVEVVLGSTKMPLEKILRLQTGSVVELNKLAGEPVDIYANGRLIARAEVVVIEDNFGVKIIEIAGMRQKFATVSG